MWGNSSASPEDPRWLNTQTHTWALMLEPNKSTSGDFPFQKVCCMTEPSQYNTKTIKNFTS